MNLPKILQLKPEQLLPIAAVFAAVGVVVNLPHEAPKSRTPDPKLFCEEMVLPKATLSGEQLAQILTVSEPSKRAKVQAIVKQPYCRLPPVAFRTGALTEREAYPLAFDPQTWLIILYEGENYVGYGFKRF